MFVGFPDLRADIESEYADGDKVVTHKVFRGTHQGEFLGIPPSGNPIEVAVIDILTVRDGRMREHWNVVDRLALLTAVGAIPPVG